MIYYTGDQHFGHANIIKHCNRPFSAVAEMDDFLVAQWNDCVGGNDTVYILGDLFFRNAVPAGEYLNRLRGKKHLIIGNHDKGWMKKVDIQEHFSSVSNLLEMSDGALKITLCHYPMMTWKDASKGSYMIYGHIHNNKAATYYPLLRSMANALNAGVDVNHFRPVTFTELLKNNEAFHNEDIYLGTAT